MVTAPERQPTDPIATVANWTIWPESEPGHFSELGRMVTTYARAEAAVHLLAGRVSGFPDAEVRARFSGMRLSDLTKRVRQMMRTNETPEKVSQEAAGRFCTLARARVQKRPVVTTLMTIANIRSVGVSKVSEVAARCQPARCHQMVQDAHLGEQSGLIPIETLVGDFASLELDDTG